MIARKKKKKKKKKKKEKKKKHIGHTLANNIRASHIDFETQLILVTIK